MAKTKAIFTPDEIVAAEQGYWINGAEKDQRFGVRLSKIRGDVNGDGYYDMLVHATYNYDINISINNTPIDKFFVLFGSKDGFVRSVANLDKKYGITIIVNDYIGDWSKEVTFVKDINGDGLDEIMVSSLKTTLKGPGMVYLIYGSKTLESVIDLRNNPENVLSGNKAGVIFTDNMKTFTDSFPSGSSVTEVRFGFSIASLGDVNGDGKPDLGFTNPSSEVGATIDSCKDGSAYVILDSNLISGDVLKEVRKRSALSGKLEFQLDGKNGFVLTSVGEGCFGGVINGIGDINGDGIDDYVASGDWMDSGGKKDVGSAFVVFGQKDFPATFTVNDLNQVGKPKGIRIDGKNEGAILGYGSKKRGRNPVRSRRRVAEPEAAGVGQDGGIERLRDGGGQVEPQRHRNVVHQLYGSAGRGVRHGK